jgi:hypothetical protein
MINIDFNAPGELYCRKTGARSRGLQFRRFPKVAQAVRFAMEELSPLALHSCLLDVEGSRFGAKELTAFYYNHNYPFARRQQ